MTFKWGVAGAALIGIAVLGCGKEDGEAASGETPAAAEQSKPAERKAPKAKKDRGEASMSIGGTAWSASRAKAEVEGSKLTISASKTERVDGKVSRQEIQLQVDDYSGPGEYTANRMGSRFVGVGIDTKAAAGSDDEAKAAAAKALSDVDHLMLAGATITVTEASNDEISGTFAWEAPAGMNKPAITGGSFRAIVDDD